MATPSTAFPLSPTPSSPLSRLPDEPALPATPDERRSNKRASTRNEDAASRYPSPPAASPPASTAAATTTTNGHRARPSYDPSLVIPPFNPNKRRSTGTASGSSAAAAPSRRNSQTQHPHHHHHQMLPSPPISTHAHAHAVRPASVSAIPAVPAIPPFHAHGHPVAAQFRVPPPPDSRQQQQQRHQGARETFAFPSPVVAQPGASVSSRSRQSVGYLPASASSQTSSSSASALAGGQGPYPHLYNPHPMPRQKVYFGPYILLQTLGEGEFGKVKLGVHGERWGEDVAIKLIKRGNVDTAQRGEKVRREIEVLKMVRHPNIVRLYDVIETEKYIGIVLEYASGGELFDHILAHRYLKERDASRLFAQLISGVSYLHRKGVVHRDLKLENLLLDRNRNVIITDFGFANRFHDAATDLMATSCGSPCYAAPELVVQDGRYVGTAVDVWSCGVILYAMLAGYLPYDDDPANPEGDNINLLYKYILNTPLVFPDWISDEPRDLLHSMLVADPAHRCTIEDVTRHSWLSKYASAFDKTVDQLEYQAQEMEMGKRHALEMQRQWLVQQQHQQQLAVQGFAPAMSRSQTSTSGMGSNVAAAATGGVSTSAARHRSAVVASNHHAVAASAPLAQQGFEHYSIVAANVPLTPTSPVPPTVVEEGVAVSPRSRTSSTASRPIVVGTAGDRASSSSSSSSSKRRSGAYVSSSPPTTQAQFVKAEADPFSFETRTTNPLAVAASSPMAPSLSAPAATSPSSSPEDSVMLHATAARTRRTSTRVPPPAPSSGSSVVAADAATTTASSEWRKKAHRATVQVEYDGGASTRRRPTPSREPSTTTSEIPEDTVVPVVVDTAGALVADDPDQVTDRRALAPSPSPSGAISVSTTTETSAAEDVVMHDALVEEPVAVVSPDVTRESTTTKDPLAHGERPTTPPLVPFPTPSTRATAAASVLSDLSSSDNNNNMDTPRKRKSSRSPTQSFITSDKATTAAPVVPPPPRPAATPAPQAAATTTQARVSTRKDSDASTVQPPPRPRAGLPSDRFSIRSFLGGSTTSVAAGGPIDERARPSSSSSSGPLDEVTNRRKANRRQKAMSLQPFRNSVSSKLPKQAKANVEASARNRSSTITPANNRSMMGPPASTSTTTTTTTTTPAWVRSTSMRSISGQSKRLSTDLEANWGSGPSSQAATATAAGATPSGKAKAVMDWFRRRGTKGYERGGGGGGDAPISTDFDRRRPASVVTQSIIEEQPSPGVEAASSAAAAVAPAVVVTTVPPRVEPPTTTTTTTTESAPSSRSASGAQSDYSVTSAASTAATTVSTSTDSRRVESKPQLPPAPIVPVPVPVPVLVPAFAPTKLRFHQGALDKHAVTYRAPNEVMHDLKATLWHMGVDMAIEGEYKIKCVRKSRKKALATTSGGGAALANANGSNTSIGPAAPASQPALSPSSSPSIPQSPSMGFRALFNRNKYASGSSPVLSTQHAGIQAPSWSSSPGSPDVDPLSSPMTTSVSQFSMLSLSNHHHQPQQHDAAAANLTKTTTTTKSQQQQPMPVYGGEKSADAGDEVRFVVELTRVKNLDKMYCVDIKRMKGGPWSYKHVYEQLLEQLDLGPVV